MALYYRTGTKIGENRRVKVGDLVCWDTVPYQFSEVVKSYGIIIELSRTGHETLAARVLLTDGDCPWLDAEKLSVLNAD